MILPPNLDHGLGWNLSLTLGKTKRQKYLNFKKMITKVKCNYSRQGCWGGVKWKLTSGMWRLALFWMQHHIGLISHTQETINMHALVSILSFILSCLCGSSPLLGMDMIKTFHLLAWLNCGPHIREWSSCIRRIQRKFENYKGQVGVVSTEASVFYFFFFPPTQIM